MKVKVTKTMARELNKAVKGNYCIERVEYDIIPWSDYEVYVDTCLLDHSEDYDYDNQEFRVLRVVYKDEMFAMNEYVTSKNLRRLMKNLRGKEPTLDNFIEEFKAEYEI